MTALAERIQTDGDISYRTAHRIVARAVLLAVERGRDATGIDAELLDLAAQEMIGKPLKLEEQVIRECLDPRHFVDQHTVTGGTAPLEVRRMAGERRQRLASDERTVFDREETIVQSRRMLREAAQTLMA